MLTADSPLDSSDAPVSKAQSVWTLVAVILWLVTYFAARVILRQNSGLGEGARVMVALMPLLPFLAFLRLFISGLRGLDELERRIQLEALALAFPLTMVMLMVLGLVELATPLSPADWSYRHVWAYLPLFYFLGVAIASRRYR